MKQWNILILCDVSQQLYAKLKSAARHIGQLARERQQLIEMGNRLRSELAKYTGKPPGGATTMNPWDHDEAMQEEVISGGTAKERDKMGEVSTVGELASRFSNKLGNLERLQYALTKQVWNYSIP